jgi:hypothetical protein
MDLDPSNPMYDKSTEEVEELMMSLSDERPGSDEDTQEVEEGMCPDAEGKDDDPAYGDARSQFMSRSRTQFMGADEEL